MLEQGGLPTSRIGRSAPPLLALALALLVLWQAAGLVFRADPLNELRRADVLFVAARYHDARLAYGAIVQRRPDFAPALVRLGIVYAVRDERDAADKALASALGRGLSRRDYDLVRLYQGRVAASAGQFDQAARLWGAIEAGSPLFSLRRVLEAERFLSIADYAGAEASYRAALLGDLPRDWRALAYSRLALLHAAGDPATARDELAQLERLDRPAPTSSVDWTAPLLPATIAEPRQLAEALDAPSDRRAQLLGQIYLRAGLYALAELQFAAVGSDSPSALSAAAYAAYTRWSAGDRAEGLRRLRALVDAHPGEPRARALLALAYLANRDELKARAQLDAARALAPRAPDTYLAWGQWYAAQHDYIAAAEEYQRALDAAPPEQRGVYALAQARFHIDTSLRLCEAGQPAAAEAASALPDDPRAWTALAATRMGCGDPAGARAAAEQAQRHSPGSAEASYYLGRALALLGERTAARSALIQAADLAPASAWRERAEAQIVALGL